MRCAAIVLLLGSAEAADQTRRIAYSGALCAAEFYQYEDHVLRLKAGMKREHLAAMPCDDDKVKTVARCVYLFKQDDDCMSIQKHVKLGIKLATGGE